MLAELPPSTVNIQLGQLVDMLKILNPCIRSPLQNK